MTTLSGAAAQGWDGQRLHQFSEDINFIDSHWWEVNFFTALYFWIYQWKSTLNIHWKDWCQSWSSNTLATWWEELTHWKRPWCWERLKAGEEGNDRGWDGWMASPTQWTRVWASSGSWWRIGKPGVLQSVGSQRAGQVVSEWHNELKNNLIIAISSFFCPPGLLTETNILIKLSGSFTKRW